MRALILVAGKGTRLGLKRTPKCMVKVNKKPVLEHLVNHLNKQGITEVIVNIHKNYEPIFKYFGTRLLYFYEPILMGEYGTEKALEVWLGDEYIIMNGDTLTNLDIKLLKEAQQFEDYNKVKYFGSLDHYAGTTYVNKKGLGTAKAYVAGAYYFDIGTPKKLAKARRFYARNNN